MFIKNTIKYIPKSKNKLLNSTLPSLVKKSIEDSKEIKEKAIFKVSSLLCSTEITNLFSGTVFFPRPISSSINIVPDIFLKSLTLTSQNLNTKKAMIFYNALIKISINYLEIIHLEKSSMDFIQKNHTIFVPFNDTLEVDLNYIPLEKENFLILKNPKIDLFNKDFEVSNVFSKVLKGNPYERLFLECNITLSYKFNLNILKDEIIKSNI